jgi:hypothetical protein
MFIPESNIVETGYGQPGRFIIESTQLPYKGFYHKDNEGRFWSGERHTDDSILLLSNVFSEPITIDTLAKNNPISYGFTRKYTTLPVSNLYASDYVIPTQDDFNRGYFNRYIISLKSSQSPYIIEVNEDKYNELIQSIDNYYYNSVVMLWKLVGPVQDIYRDNIRIESGVRDTNLRSITEASKVIKDISILLTNPLQYARITSVNQQVEYGVRISPSLTAFANVNLLPPQNVFNINTFDPFAVASSPTPSITVTPSVTVTPSITSTPSVTVTPSISITPSITVTPSISITPSITVTPSISITPSITVTPSITRTPSITPTRTPSISITPSVSSSPPSCDAFTYNIGDIYTDNNSIDLGFVYYIDNCNLYIVSFDDIDVLTEFGCSGVSINTANNTDIGQGCSNLAIILASGCDTSEVTNNIDNYVVGDEGGWCFPTLGDWDTIFSNKTTLNNNGANLQSDRYWSSNSVDGNNDNWYTFNLDGGGSVSTPRTDRAYVRAVIKIPL